MSNYKTWPNFDQIFRILGDSWPRTSQKRWQQRTLYNVHTLKSLLFSLMIGRRELSSSNCSTRSWQMENNVIKGITTNTF